MELEDCTVAVVEDDGVYIDTLYERLNVRAFTGWSTIDDAIAALVDEKEIENVDVLIIDLMLQVPRTVDLGTSTIDAGLNFHKYLESHLHRVCPVVFHTGATILNDEVDERIKVYAAESTESRRYVPKTYEVEMLENALKELINSN